MFTYECMTQPQTSLYYFAPLVSLIHARQSWAACACHLLFFVFQTARIENAHRCLWTFVIALRILRGRKGDVRLWPVKYLHRHTLTLRHFYNSTCSHLTSSHFDILLVDMFDVYLSTFWHLCISTCLHIHLFTLWLSTCLHIYIPLPYKCTGGDTSCTANSQCMSWCFPPPQCIFMVSDHCFMNILYFLTILNVLAWKQKPLRAW